jgi:choline dehydrogenase-like flavoprotein
MTTMFVRHTVTDYKTWRKAYDDFAPFQKANVVMAQAVYQAARAKAAMGPPCTAPPIRPARNHGVTAGCDHVGQIGCTTSPDCNEIASARRRPIVG